MAITRNAGATYFIPSENEWYKAAYYKGGEHRTRATGPTRPRATRRRATCFPRTGTNNANYYRPAAYTDPTNYLTPVGAFAASPGPYGTYDMGGDVWQWNEANITAVFGSDTWRVNCDCSASAWPRLRAPPPFGL